MSNARILVSAWTADARLTLAIHKKLANLKASVAMYYAHYNFVRVHRTLRCAPTMAAGLTDRLWSFEELVEAE